MQSRYFLSFKSRSPVIGIDIGHGSPINEVGKKGGLSLRPNIGFKLASKGKSDMLIDTGIQFQQASFFQDNGNGMSNETKILNQRIYFRIGYVF